MRRNILFVLIFWLFSLSPALADEITGKVIRVADGDTFTMLLPGKTQAKVRLAEIDAPERGQAWGGIAKDRLEKMIKGKTVTVKYTEEDRYGRIIGTVYLYGVSVDVNFSMVYEGNAWVYTHYARRPDLINAEEIARSRKAGLWSLHEKERIPPWQWRAQARQDQITSR